ncbi:proteasome subunit beta type-6-like [Lycium ferocissimum]|uniref:proteasome subunit beta type-6-like n=1 Tax=Lycium ferocissimum TaxID=112874 RepID=UPI002816933C|nr:proteasome subunit beta type-6-like [Lycium ferocissimum]
MSLFIIDSNESHPSNTTTIIGVTYDDGVILGSTNTITQLTANVVLCNCALGTRIVLEDVHSFILDQESTMVAAETIGTTLSSYNYTKKNMLQTGLIIGEGSKLYEICYGGIVMEKSNFSVGGHGVTYLRDFLEKEWKKGMNEEEAEALLLKALSMNFSLSGVNTCGVQTMSVNSKGVTRAFHPYDTLLPIRKDEMVLEHVNEKEQLKGIRANLISLLKINVCL